MRKISIIIILLSFNLYFFAQSLVDSIKIEDNIIKIRSDKIQNIYIQKENQLIKLDTKTGKQIKSYSNLQLGAISLVDVQNPMKILLYYKEFNSFLFLNSQLSLITNEIDLTSLDIYSCSAIAYSKTNSFFIFDENAKKIIQIDQNNNKITESIDLSFIDNLKFVRQITEANNKIYLLTDSSILLLDNIGNFIKKINLKTDKIIVENDIIYYKKGNFIMGYNVKSFEKKSIILSKEKIIDFCILQNKIYLLNKSKIRIFNFH